MKFRPLHDRVVIRRIEQEAKTADGIIIPDTAKGKSQEGEVIAVGPSARDERSEIQRLDAQRGDYGDLVQAGVIDPAKVVRVALQDAASVAGLLITTEAMVAEKPEKKPAGPACRAAAWAICNSSPGIDMTAEVSMRLGPPGRRWGSRGGGSGRPATWP